MEPGGIGTESSYGDSRHEKWSEWRDFSHAQARRNSAYLDAILWKSLLVLSLTSYSYSRDENCLNGETSHMLKLGEARRI